MSKDRYEIEGTGVIKAVVNSIIIMVSVSIAVAVIAQVVS